MREKLYVRCALATLVLSLALVALGGFVHNTGSSLACPDWPLCYGQVFPEMTGSVAIEHSHRLLATLVGVFTIGLVVFSSGRLRRLSLYALAMVVFQGALGGATVLLGISPLMSTAHLATSQIFLAFILYLWLRSRHDLNPSTAAVSARGPVLAVAGLVYVQMLLGASIRHGGAGSICGLGWDSVLLCREAGFEGPATAWPEVLAARFHMLHRYFGVLCGLAVWAVAFRHNRPGLLWASLLVAAQIGLGVMALGTFIGPVSTTLHLLVASLLWLALLQTAWKEPRTSGAPSGTLAQGGMA